MWRLAIVVCGLGLLSGAATSQPTQEAGQRWMRTRIAWMFLHSQQRSNIDLDGFRRVAGDVFARSADGEPAVTRATLERAQRPLMASARAQILAGAFGLDINADGVLDQAELQRAADHERRLRMSPGFVDTLRNADANGDGRVDVTEVLALARRWIDERRGAFDRFDPWLEDFIPLALDRDGDGRVTRDEVDPAAREAFAAIDADGDGRLSEAELRAATAGTSDPIRRTLLSP